jgi:hypothetical protein
LRRREFGPGQPSPPIWPCSTRGFPCPGCRHPGGGLLPHLFTLAKCARPEEAGSRGYRGPAAEVQATPAVYFLWHYPWPRAPTSLRLLVAQPPGVTRRVALLPPSRVKSTRGSRQLESGLSSRPPLRLAAQRSPDSPAGISISNFEIRNSQNPSVIRHLWPPRKASSKPGNRIGAIPSPFIRFCAQKNLIFYRLEGTSALQTKGLSAFLIVLVSIRNTTPTDQPRGPPGAPDSSGQWQVASG